MTALVSLVALQGVEAFATEVNVDIGEQQQAVVAAESNVQSSPAAKPATNSHTTNSHAGNKQSSGANRPASSAPKSATTHSQASARKGAMNAPVNRPAPAQPAPSAMPATPAQGVRVVVSGDMEARMFYNLDEEAYHLPANPAGKIFQGCAGRGTYDSGTALDPYIRIPSEGAGAIVHDTANTGPNNGMVEGTVKMPDVCPQFQPYQYLTPLNHGDYYDKFGTVADGVVNLKAEAKTPALGGLTYGAELSLITTPTQSVGNTTYENHRVYIGGDYGYFTAGYQKTADAEMRIGADELVPGGKHWFFKANLEGRDGMSPFYLTPGLFTETFYSGANFISQKINDYNDALGYAPLAATLPFSVAYYSPVLAGFRVGVSYVPYYNTDAYSHDYSKIGINVRRGDTGGDVNMSAANPKALIGPAYQNVIGAGLTYGYATKVGGESLMLKIGVTGEYGKSKTSADFATKLKPAIFSEYDDLMGVNIGVSGDWAGVRAAASYGYIGKSGVPKLLHSNGVDAPSKVTGDDVVELGNLGAMRALYRDEFTHYWTAGMSYGYNGAGIGASYFGSFAHDTDRFHDFSVTANYDFEVKNKAKMSPFISLHYFTTEQNEKSVLGSRQEDSPFIGLHVGSVCKKVDSSTMKPNCSGNAAHDASNFYGEYVSYNNYKKGGAVITAYGTKSMYEVLKDDDEAIDATTATVTADEYKNGDDRLNLTGNAKHITEFLHKENNSGSVIQAGLKFTF